MPQYHTREAESQDNRNLQILHFLSPEEAEDLLCRIYHAMNGHTWSADTLDQIAGLFNFHGVQFLAPEDVTFTEGD
jgi:hypothetical protein